MNKRLASIKDTKAISHVLEMLRLESRYKAFPLNKEKLIGFVNYLISNKSSLVLIAENSGIIGLFIANIDEMYFSDCTTASDFIFYVHPSRRGEGIGSELIADYFQWAKKMKVDDISLSTSTGISDDAIKSIAGKYNMEKKGVLYGRVDYVRNT